MKWRAEQSTARKHLFIVPLAVEPACCNSGLEGENSDGIAETVKTCGAALWEALERSSSVGPRERHWRRERRKRLTFRKLWNRESQKAVYELY